MNHLEGQVKYKKPPKAIYDLIMSNETPLVAISSDNKKMIQIERSGLKDIKSLSEPELKLAGIRINPETNGQSRMDFFKNLSILDLKTLKRHKIRGIAPKARIQNISWSPDNTAIAFTITTDSGIELWYANINTYRAKKLTKAVLNDFFSGNPYKWASDGKTIFFCTIIENRRKQPQKQDVPTGPIIQVSSKEKSTTRTFQDLLKDANDILFFEYYASSHIKKTNLNGKITSLGIQGIIQNFELSPDANFIYVNSIQKPYSYAVPYYRFPQKHEIYDITGKFIKLLADIPAALELPQGFDSVRTGPRSFQWRADKEAELFWVEAQDGGDSKKDAEIRDQLFYLSAPFSQRKRKSINTKKRFGGIRWLNDNVAVISEYFWSTREIEISGFTPYNHNSKQKWFSFRSQDRYNNPGSFELTKNKFGKSVLLSSNSNTLFLSGQGASADGDKPFLDSFNIKKLKTKRIWQSKAPFFETVASIINKKKIIIRRESQNEPPNLFFKSLKSNKLKRITKFKNPYPALQKIQSELIKYKRKDGLDLTGKLYLPPKYTSKKDGTLPVLLWAYPEDYKNAKDAAQISGSPYKFTRISWASPILWATQGFAILDHPSMPIVSQNEKEPNDTFAEQLIMNAEAAIEKLEELKIGDKTRVGIGGHSYGAFMTANLLTHSKLFAAGIARSGAYNRTLTPFGFQSEERTFWQAPDLYLKMSPFNQADKINAPILLIHGEADNNSGTYPMQSERYFDALKANGKITRLVLLPHESHSYQASESILHMAWEMDEWLKKYVKNKET